MFNGFLKDPPTAVSLWARSDQKLLYEKNALRTGLLWYSRQNQAINLPDLNLTTACLNRLSSLRLAGRSYSLGCRLRCHRVNPNIRS